MARPSKKFRQAGAAEAAPVASNEDLARLSKEVAALASLDIEELRGRWRKLFRAPAPGHLPRYLLLRIIAYRIQANELGDLDRETVRFLDAVAEDWQKRRAAGQGNSKRPPPVPPVPDKRSLKPGTILAREHEGELHRVMVLKDGFAWNGATCRSLSEVARAITGTNWNGPRFFGLRDKTNGPCGQWSSP
jgi:Protein of unknown function (DUF2924)